MNEQSREFYISSAVNGESGKTTAIGRAGDLPIPVGTRFTLVYKTKKQDYRRDVRPSVERENEKPIDITVEAVSAYGKTMRELPGSSTGRLIFNGDALDRLPQGWMLSEK